MKKFKGNKSNIPQELKNAGWEKMKRQSLESDFTRYTKFDDEVCSMIYLDIDVFGRFYLMEQKSPNGKLEIVGTEYSAELESDTTYKGRIYNKLLTTIYEEVAV